MRCAISALAALVLQCAGPLAPAAWAVDTEETPAASQADPDYVAGKKAVAAEDWNSAIALLSKAALRDDNNADVHNLSRFLIPPCRRFRARVRPIQPGAEPQPAPSRRPRIHRRRLSPPGRPAEGRRAPRRAREDLPGSL